VSVIRLNALESLKCIIADAIPELDGNICAGVGAPNHRLAYPSLSINVTRFTYEPQQAEVQRSLSPDAALMQMGWHIADVELVVTAQYPELRYQIEESIVQLFLGDDCHPGVLQATITSCEAWGKIYASFELNGETWIDEFAFEQKYSSTLGITGMIPALVTKRGAYTMRDLRTALVEDFSVAEQDVSFTESTSGADVFKISAAGVEKL